jgi:DNA primase
MMRVVSEDLEFILSELGMRIGRSSGKEVWALCPNPDHDDTRPNNFSVNKETGQAFCFACRYGRPDIVSLTVDVLGVDSWTALSWLRDRGATLTKRVNRVTATRKEIRQAKTKSGYSVRGEFSIFEDPPDSALEKRNISRESADLYDLRWSRGGFVVPVKTRSEGRLVGWQEKGRGYFKNYPTNIGMDQYLFGAHEFEGSRPIVVESPLDVVRLHSEGFGAVALFGTALSHARIDTISRLIDKGLIVAMDNDGPGIQASKRILRVFASQVPTWVISYSHTGAKDVGDMTSSEILTALNQAVFSARIPASRVVRRV